MIIIIVGIQQKDRSWNKFRSNSWGSRRYEYVRRDYQNLICCSYLELIYLKKEDRLKNLERVKSEIALTSKISLNLLWI